MNQRQSAFDLHLEKANTLVSSKQFREAEKIVLTLVAEQPKNVDVAILLSIISERRGMIYQQISSLEKVREFSDTRKEVFIHLAFAYLKIGNFGQAGIDASNAIEDIHPPPDILQAAAKIFHAVGAYQKCADALELAITRGAITDAIFYELGMALTLIGSITMAQKAYEKCLSLNPSHNLAYAGISKIRKATPEVNHISIMTQLIKLQRNPWKAINLHHGLAKELDDISQYQLAFSTLKNGKKKLATSCPHSPFKCADNINHLLEVYKHHFAELKDVGNVDFNTEKAPIFVVGMPRTGTTIVERILSNHSHVSSIGESLQLSMQLKKELDHEFSGLVDASVLQQLWSTIDFKKLGTNYLSSTEYLHKNEGRFVDKLPLNIQLAGIVLRAIPAAKIVCLVRDPLDTLIGNYRQVFEYSSPNYTYTLNIEACAQFIIGFRRLVDWLDNTFHERFSKIAYEKIVNNPEMSARNILQFCALEWEEGCIDIHKNTASIGTASAAQVKEPIHQRSKGKALHYKEWIETALKPETLSTLKSLAHDNN